MSLHARIARVDDYSGELLQELRKLEMEKDRGVLDRQQQEDFLGDLRKAVERRDLRPMRTRAVVDGLLAAALASAAAFLPPPLRQTQAVLAALCVLTLGLSTWRWTLYRRRWRHDRRWLGHLESALTAGGSIFDSNI